MYAFSKYLFLLLLLNFSFTGMAQIILPEYRLEKIHLDDSQHFERIYNMRIEDQSIKKIAEQQSAYLVSKSIKIPLENIQPFLAFSASWECDDPLNLTQIVFQHTTDNENWSPWIELKKDAHVDNKKGEIVSQLQFLDAKITHIKFILRLNKDFENPVKNIALHFYNPRESDNPFSQNSDEVEMDLCSCPMPNFESRDDWCPLGCPPNPNPSATDITHLIVHHSATGNGPADWPAVVRSIWNQHVNVNGWSDIGYNWLVDPEGNLYEGRGKDIQGAHFCGTNARTAGICMLGNFSVNLPSAAAVSQLEEFLAWNCCVDDLDPLTTSTHTSSGLDLHHISGHQDGCATECPGGMFYPTFDHIRQNVSSYINETCNPTTSIPSLVSQEESFQIFPNPNEGVFTIQHYFASPVQVDLFSLDGKKIGASFSVVNQEQQINIQYLSPGVYIIRLQSEKNSSFQKLLIR